MVYFSYLRTHYTIDDLTMAGNANVGLCTLLLRRSFKEIRGLFFVIARMSWFCVHDMIGGLAMWSASFKSLNAVHYSCFSGGRSMTASSDRRLIGNVWFSWHDLYFVMTPEVKLIRTKWNIRCMPHVIFKFREFAADLYIFFVICLDSNLRLGETEFGWSNRHMVFSFECKVKVQNEE